jgi:hypothetical protein
MNDSVLSGVAEQRQHHLFIFLYSYPLKGWLHIINGLFAHALPIASIAEEVVRVMYLNEPREASSVPLTRLADINGIVMVHIGSKRTLQAHSQMQAEQIARRFNRTPHM